MRFEKEFLGSMMLNVYISMMFHGFKGTVE